MKEEKRIVTRKYFICFIIASLITFIIFAINGYFTDDIAVNVRILADGFSISGLLLILFAGMMYVSGEGALLGIGFIVRNIVLWFVPMGRMNHESYAKYRERKLGERKKNGDHCILVTGVVFLLVGIVFLVIFEAKFTRSSF